MRLTAEWWGVGDGQLDALSDTLHGQARDDMVLETHARRLAKARHLRRIEAYVTAYLQGYREHYTAKVL